MMGTTGSGKSEVILSRLVRLVEAGQGGPGTLVLLPDRKRAARWRAALDSRLDGAYAPPRVTTVYSLASHALRAWWPEISLARVQSRGSTGAKAALEPALLTYETAQFLMSEIVSPRLEQGYFAGLSMRPQRLVSQLLDNLNKAALNGYDIEAVEERLSRSWQGPEDRLRHYAQMQDCIRAFRSRCLELGLVDLSLILEHFRREIMGVEPRRLATLAGIRHLLVDDLDESAPVMHDFVAEALKGVDSALLGFDPWGGQRVFLGADPIGAAALADRCDRVVRLRGTVGIDGTPPAATPAPASDRGRPQALARLAAGLFDAEGPAVLAGRTELGDATQQPARQDFDALAEWAAPSVDLRLDLSHRGAMIEEAAGLAAAWVRSGTSAEDIAILAPYLDGGLRFTLEEALADRGIRAVSHRRHRMLREEPAVRAALTAAALAHPSWGIPPEPYAVAEALSIFEPAIDAARAGLLTRGLYDRATGRLLHGDRLDMQDHDRIGFAALEAYASWQGFLAGAASEDPAAAEALDRFLRRLFAHRVRRQPPSLESAEAFDQLLVSVKRFEDVAPLLEIPAESVGPAFLRLVHQGTVTAQHHPAAPAESDEASRAGGSLHISPAHSYLVDDRRHRAQIWLDVGSLDWWRPPQQPLTNPWLLSRSWPDGLAWSPDLDAAVRDRVLARLCAALAARADDRVAMLACAEGKLGVPAKGPLLRLAARLELPEPRIEGAQAP